MTKQAWIALVLHLVALFFYALSGLLAPPYAVALLLALWLVLLWWLIRLRREGWKPVIVPAVAAGIWFTVLMLGDALLGWTA